MAQIAEPGTSPEATTRPVNGTLECTSKGFNRVYQIPSNCSGSVPDLLRQECGVSPESVAFASAQNWTINFKVGAEPLVLGSSSTSRTRPGTSKLWAEAQRPPADRKGTRSFGDCVKRSIGLGRCLEVPHLDSRAQHASALCQFAAESLCLVHRCSSQAPQSVCRQTATPAAQRQQHPQLPSLTQQQTAPGI